MPRPSSAVRSAVLAEDLAREESKARKRVEEEKARDEAPEVEPEGEEGKLDSESSSPETPSDSKGKSVVVDRSEEILTPKKPTPKPKKSTPSTPEQAAKEALWKFQAAFPLGKVKSSTSTFLCLPFRLPSRHADALRSAKLAGL